LPYFVYRKLRRATKSTLKGWWRGLKNLPGDSTTSSHADTVAIGKPERQGRKASHCGSKQQ